MRSSFPFSKFSNQRASPLSPSPLSFEARTPRLESQAGGLICLLARCSLRSGVHQFACMLLLPSFLPSFSDRPRTTRHERTPTPPRSLPHSLVTTLIHALGGRVLDCRFNSTFFSPNDIRHVRVRKIVKIIIASFHSSSLCFFSVGH